MLPFDYCWPMRPSTRAHLSLCFRISPLRKCFASLHFTDKVVDLVSSVAVGLTFKDFLTKFRLVCHVLSTNRSCQTKGPKSKTEHLSAWVAYHRPCPLRKLFSEPLPSWKLGVIVNLLPVLLFHQQKINTGLARKVAVGKFNWVFWSCDRLFAWLFVAVAL